MVKGLLVSVIELHTADIDVFVQIIENIVWKHCQTQCQEVAVLLNGGQESAVTAGYDDPTAAFAGAFEKSPVI